ncbi:MAG: ribonuclease HIII [Bacilli bacterium]|nr:ribonuclease HIII [Bacilli bacterium]
METKPTVISIEIDDAMYQNLANFYLDFASKAPNEYIDIFAQGEKVSVAIYKKNKKGKRKVVFQGDRALEESRMFFHDGNYVAPVSKKAPKSVFPQIGSDEVGTGDAFGPICVAAAYVTSADIPLLEELGVTDSKKMTDEKILEIGPTLINRFHYSQLSLPNSKFNEVHDEFNMNAIKAKMHNQCYINLINKIGGRCTIYQDQFADESLYYKYLKDEENVVHDVIFHTKGESYYLSVALGSVIARYSFLRKMQEMDAKYGMHFPFGSAGEQIDAAIKEFIEKHGKKELSNVAKLNFKNVIQLL